MPRVARRNAYAKYLYKQHPAVRGGSRNFTSYGMRSAFHDSSAPDTRVDIIGFRIKLRRLL